MGTSQLRPFSPLSGGHKKRLHCCFYSSRFDEMASEAFEMSAMMSGRLFQHPSTCFVVGSPSPAFPSAPFETLSQHAVDEGPAFLVTNVC